MGLLDNLLIVLGAIGGALAANQWIIPLIESWLEKRRQKKQDSINQPITIESSLLEIEKNNNSLYENQINFFVAQIDILQQQLKKKTDELNELNSQFDELRKTLMNLKEDLHKERLINNELRHNLCDNMNCPNRINNNENETQSQL